MSFGLTQQQKILLLNMAKSNMYYERYLSNKFNVSDDVVRIICAEDGYVCKRLDKDLKHYDGYYITKERATKAAPVTICYNKEREI